MTKTFSGLARTCLQKLGAGKTLAIVFLACALPTGLGCALLTPIGNVSDEPQHMARADGLRTGQLTGIQPASAQSAGVMMNSAMFQVAVSEVYETLYSNPLPPQTRAKAQAITWTNQTVFCPTQMVDYFPAFYVPGALGMAAGKALGLTPLHAVFLGRIAMLLAFLAVGSMALMMTQFGTSLMFAILMLPTTLHLAASYNPDGLTIASCALVAALLTRAKPGPTLAWGVALAVLTVVASAKIPYILLYLACLAPLRGRHLYLRLALVALACLPPMAWLYHTLHGGFSPWHGPPYHPGPLWPGARNIWLTTIEPVNNAHVLLAHPSAIITLPFTSLPTQWRFIWPYILAQISWDAVRVPDWMYHGLYLSMSAALAGAMAARPAGWRPIDAALILAMIVATFMGIELSLYVTWNIAGAPDIYGVTSRYFLLFMPFFVFVLPELGKLLSRLPGAARLPQLEAGWFVLPSVVMAAVNVVAMPAFIYHIYQMPGP